MNKIKEFFENCLIALIIGFLFIGIPLFVGTLLRQKMGEEDNEKILLIKQCKEIGGQYIELNTRDECIK